jgi:threonine synthase
MEDLNKNNIFEMTQKETKELQKYYFYKIKNVSMYLTDI